ncbi:sulfotransferase family 2 domain-containing protein [Pseudomonas koreensis]|uniref:Sulfotransferase family 2 domain-containing protein n=1 Tax=Pseudomonas koreensis TaxID=198620 RepID=A0A9X3BC71_9PSED|nr:sulfotransferase family 2 domain-containing protein [Pseudomonas koreensis]MCU7248704.1 sulfotransferase family 2 domain-containing protein [Pseudomonas koreensis]
MTSSDDQRLLDFFTWNSCVSQERKLFYVATPKVACTSLKWWFAELEGVAEAIRQLKTSSETDPELVIHDSLHAAAPQLCMRSPEQLQQIRDDGYFSFALVRNPYKRLFSAWQSKIMLREPFQIEPYRGQAFVECPVETMLDVATAFESFLEYLNTYEANDFKDWHWAPQYDLLKPELFPYSAVSKIEDTSALNEALRAHLGDAYVNPFTTSRANESLIPYLPEFISPRSKELIDRLYAKDFEVYGYATELPPAKETFSQEHLTLALKGIELLRGRHLRIAEMRKHFGDQISQLVVDKQWLAEQRENWMDVCKEKESELVALQAFCAGEVQKLQDVHAELERVKAGLAESNAALAQSNAELAQSNAQLAKSNSERLQVASDLAVAESNLARFKSELVQADSERLRLQADLGAVESERDQLKSELEQANSERTQLRSDLSSKEAALEQLQAELVQTNIEKTQVRSDLAQSNSDLAQSNSELARLKAELAHSSTELAQSSNELALSNSELALSNSELARSNTDLLQSNAQLEQSRFELENIKIKVVSLISEQEAFALKHRRYLAVYRFVEAGVVNRMRKVGHVMKGRKGE